MGVTSLFFAFIMSLINGNLKSEDDHVIIFYRIDNSVEILVNDSIVYESGIIHNNPSLGDTYKIPLGIYLTDAQDEVIIRVNNGVPPNEEQNDTHWEIKYSIFNGDERIDYFWDYSDDNEIGLVFEERYFF